MCRQQTLLLRFPTAITFWAVYVVASLPH
jgi:hypothetical protein